MRRRVIDGKRIKCVYGDMTEGIRSQSVEIRKEEEGEGVEGEKIG